jgi:hypothetical protein
VTELVALFGKLWRLDAWDLFPDMRLMPAALEYTSSEAFVTVGEGKSGGTCCEDIVEMEAEVSFRCIIEDLDVRVSVIEDLFDDPALVLSGVSEAALTGLPTPTAFWKRLYSPLRPCWT